MCRLEFILSRGISQSWVISFWACEAMDSFASEFLSVCANVSNVTSEVWLVQDRTSGTSIAVFLLLFLVIGLPWNLLVIVTIVKQKLYTQPTIILLLSLVITDLILLVFHLPLVTIVGFHGEFIFGNSDHSRCLVCRNSGFISLIFVLNSIFTIALMSIDRFLFIYRPLHYNRYITKWRTVVAIAAAWLVAVVFSILPLTGFGNIIYSDRIAACVVEASFDGSIYPALLLSIMCLAVLPIIVCNMWLCIIVLRNIRAIYNIRVPLDDPTSSYSRNVKRKRREKEAHLIKVFGILFCSNVLTWFPVVVVYILEVSGVTVSIQAIAATEVFFLSQTVVHPIIETTLIKEVRVPLKSLIFCCCTAVKAKIPPDLELETQKTENTSASTGKCCLCGLFDICGAALLFQDPPSDISNNVVAQADAETPYVAM